MSSTALAYSGYVDFRRARRLSHAKPKSRPLRPWSEVSVAGTPLQATAGHPPHIARPTLIALFIVAVAIHFGLAWYFDSYSGNEIVEPIKHELSIDIVRPPKPLEPPKTEPPKPPPPKPQPQQAQLLPQIQQSEALPATVGESTEAAVAVAPVVTQAPPAPPPPITAPIGRAGYLNNPEPEDPPQAIRQNWQGTAELRVRVLANGKVESVEIKKSTGKKLLDDEAVRTVKLWLFTPAKQGETAVDGWVIVPIDFSFE